MHVMMPAAGQARYLSKSATWNERGFSLIEAVIAIAVLGLGLVGIAGMQVVSLTGNVDSNDLTIAANLNADMMERIRFNWRNAAVYNGLDTRNPATALILAQPEASGDYTQWQARLAASGLRNAYGSVSVTVTGPLGLTQQLITTTIWWNQKMSYAGAGLAAAGASGGTQFRLRKVVYSTTITPT